MSRRRRRHTERSSRKENPSSQHLHNHPVVTTIKEPAGPSRFCEGSAVKPEDTQRGFGHRVTLHHREPAGPTVLLESSMNSEITVLTTCLQANIRLEISDMLTSDDPNLKTTIVLQHRGHKTPDDRQSSEDLSRDSTPNLKKSISCTIQVTEPEHGSREQASLNLCWTNSAVPMPDGSPSSSKFCRSSKASFSFSSFSDKISLEIPPPEQFAEQKTDVLDCLTEGVALCQISPRVQISDPVPLPEESQEACPPGHFYTDPKTSINRLSFTKNFIQNHEKMTRLRNNSVAVLETESRCSGYTDIPLKRRKTFPGSERRLSKAQDSVPSYRESFSSATLSTYLLSPLLCQVEKADGFYAETDKFLALGSRRSSSSSSYRPSSSSTSGTDSVYKCRTRSTFKHSISSCRSDETPEELFMRGALQVTPDGDALFEELNESGFDEELLDFEDSRLSCLKRDRALKIHVIPPSPYNSEERINKPTPQTHERDENAALRDADVTPPADMEDQTRVMEPGEDTHIFEEQSVKEQEVTQQLRPPADAEEKVEKCARWEKKRRLFRESKHRSSAGASSITSNITEESDTLNSEDTHSVDVSMRHIEERGFYTETFHSLSWIYHDDFPQNSPRCLTTQPRPPAIRERTVKICKGSGEYPWGFRIQFSKPIVVTEVDTNGAAEEAGLIVGDYVLAVNGSDVTEAPHSEAAELARQGPDLLTLIIGSDIGRLPNTPRPACRGYLHKRTQSSLLKGWRKRWFVLRHDCCLYYYRTKREEGKSRAQSVLSLEGALVQPDAALGKSFVFSCCPVSGDRVYYFCAASNQEMKRWLEAMNRAVHPITQNHVWVDVTRHNSGLPPMAVKNPECLGLLHRLEKESWVQHYGVLKDGCLYLYHSIRSTCATGGIYLHGYTVRDQQQSSRRSMFELKPPSEEFKSFLFFTENSVETKRWISAITSSIRKWLPLHQAIQDYMSKPLEETRM